jgi:hypothetical protein
MVVLTLGVWTIEHGGTPFYASLRGALLYSAALAPFAAAIAAAATGG